MRWCGAFGLRGIATVYIDTPGTGEARHLGPISADFDDILDGVFDLLTGYHTVDPRRVGILGISLGGNLAIRSLAYDRRIAAAAAVTPPYDPARWLSRASQATRAELAELLRGHDSGDVEALAAPFALAGLPETIQRPTLIIGGGRDTTVPPAEATRLAARLGPLCTLDWYPAGGHVLYREIPAWTTDAAGWFGAVFAHQSTRVDPRDAVAAWRDALFAPAPAPEWDEALESATLLPDSPDEWTRSESP